MSAEEFKALLDGHSGPVTADIFEAALLRQATCKLEADWPASCPAYRDLLGVHFMREGGERVERVAGEPALRHLRHPSAAVRHEAVSFAASYVFWSDRTSEREQLYLDALRSEARVEVLARLVRYADPTNNPAIGRFVLRSLAHTDERVRTGALESLARPTVAARVPDAVLHIAAATSAVRSTDERIRGCSLIGSFDDPRAAGILAARLADETLPLEVYDACFAALVRTWARAPEPLQPSREGYELTLKLLNAKPRSRARQSPWGVAAVGAAHKHSPEWAQRVRDFYDVRAVSTALASVVLDDAAGLEARSKAGSALVELDQGATILSTIEASRSQGTTKSMRLADEMASKQRRKHAPPSTDPLAD